jgi:hypothetical protein
MSGFIVRLETEESDGSVSVREIDASRARNPEQAMVRAAAHLYVLGEDDLACTVWDALDSLREQGIPSGQYSFDRL